MKGKKEMNAPLPTVLNVASTVQSHQPVVTTTGPIKPMGEVVAISVPLFHWTAGTARRKLDVRLTGKQATKLKAIQLGLEQQEAQLDSGRFVSNPVDAIRWILENAS